MRSYEISYEYYEVMYCRICTILGRDSLLYTVTLLEKFFLNHL